MNLGQFISQTKEHNYVQDPYQVDARRVLNQVKQNAITSQLSTQRILASNIIGVNQSTTYTLPAVPSITHLIRRTVRIANTHLSSPNSLASIAFSTENTLSHMGKQFLLSESGADDNRILIFSTNNYLEHLRYNDYWYYDETFKNDSLLFPQRSTVDCKINYRKSDGVKKARLDVCGTYNNRNVSPVKVYYLVALKIARAKKPHSIADALLLPAVKDICRIMIGV
ncbi:hypothetical protein RF11_11738 [Thelohanellus kitauei]|uniref:Uncharacterized protein n=1 Tax=Thelohanellus kitauei TaxID=669202 RepID=A0A0C2MZA5_THEKT|nr:hypothetical protein RF11_11738 [Thelohanellus kitauei]